MFQGQEPPLFLQLFNGLMVIYGFESGIYLVYGSSMGSEARMEEQPAPVVYRAHAVYVVFSDRKIRILEGHESKESSRSAAIRLAKHVRANYTAFAQFANEPVIETCDLIETAQCRVIEADHWVQVCLPPSLLGSKVADPFSL